MSQIDTDLIEQFRDKRFLFVLGQFTKLGGAERQALLLAEQLKLVIGCQVMFLAWGGAGRVTDELKKLDIPYHTFPLNWRGSKLQRMLTLRRLAKWIRKDLQPDYLLPYIGFNCKIIGLIWRQTGAKFSWWNQRDEGREVYGSRVERRVIRQLPSIVSNSFEGRDFLMRTFGLPASRVEVINNGIKIPKAPDRGHWRNQLRLRDDDFLITMVANLTHYKDHDTLLRAFAMLRDTDRGKNCHLALAGHFEEAANSLKIKAFDLGLCGHLHFLGMIDSPHSLFAASDLVVHSSDNEGCPNAVLEAMAHGLCVCGTDIAGMRQAVGTLSADKCLVRSKDPEALSDIMSKAISSPEYRQKVGILNQKRVRDEFSPQKLLKAVLVNICSHSLI